MTTEITLLPYQELWFNEPMDGGEISKRMFTPARSSARNMVWLIVDSLINCPGKRVRVLCKTTEEKELLESLIRDIYESLGADIISLVDFSVGAS